MLVAVPELPEVFVEDKADHYAAAVYGSIVAAALIEAFRSEHAHAETTALAVLSTMAVFFLAHVWSTIVGERIHRRERRLGLHRVAEIARAEWPLVEASFAPVFVLILGWAGVLRDSDSRGARADRLHRPALRLGPRGRAARVRPLDGSAPVGVRATARSG